MKFGVLRFPGSNCDQDCVLALRDLGHSADYIWHKDTTVEGVDAIVIPGGFSYGDYLRCGAIARFSPIMQAVQEHAAAGKLVIGICNGFQILCEARLLPGALIRNKNLHFRCEDTLLRVVNTDSPFTNQFSTGQILQIPIAHGEGNYSVDPETLKELQQNGQILLQYCSPEGEISQEANPNGSTENIAGICNTTRNVFGLMPHPERACHSRLGSSDGRGIFESMIQHFNFQSS